MVQAFTQLGIDGHVPTAPLTVDSPLEDKRAFAAMNEELVGGVLALSVLAVVTWREALRAEPPTDSAAFPTASAGLRARDSSHAALDGMSRRPVRARSDNDISNATE